MVVDGVPVQAVVEVAVVGVERGADVVVFAVGFFVAEGVVPVLPEVVGAVGLVVVPDFAVAGVDDDATDAGGVVAIPGGGDWLSWTSTFDGPLLHPAAASTSARPAALIPVVRMLLRTGVPAKRFSDRSQAVVTNSE